MSFTRFRPFEHFATPFAIGLQRLDPLALVDIDVEYERYIREKIALFETVPAEVYRAQADTLDAQSEILDLFERGLSETHPAMFRFMPDRIALPTLDLHFERSDWQPLALASLLVQDDLILMRRKEDGWNLVAASLCFPSFWSLAEKFGKPLEVIHAPVPGLGGKTGERIRRIFDNLLPDQPVWRENWTIHGDNRLRALHDKAPGEDYHGKNGNDFMRVEYQTLRKLPSSGDILFTVKIVMKPLKDLANSENAAEIAANLIASIDALDDDQRRYKGLHVDMDPVMEVLNSLAQAGSPLTAQSSSAPPPV